MLSEIGTWLYGLGMFRARGAVRLPGWAARGAGRGARGAGRGGGSRTFPRKVALSRPELACRSVVPPRFFLRQHILYREELVQVDREYSRRRREVTRGCDVNVAGSECYHWVAECGCSGGHVTGLRRDPRRRPLPRRCRCSSTPCN